MNTKYFIYCLLLSFLITGNVQARREVKKHKEYARLLEAYTQRTMPGIQGARPQTSTHFILIWEDSKYPSGFFWRGENGWLPCSMVKAHKITKRSAGIPQGVDYMIENVSANMIHRGDTLQLTPVAGGKFPVPGEIPDDVTNTLYFKTGGSSWLAFPVKNITRKQDIAMP